MVKYTSAPFLTQYNNPESKVWFTHHFRMFSPDGNRCNKKTLNPLDYLDWQFEIGWIIYCSVCGIATISVHSSMFHLPKYLPWGRWRRGPKAWAWGGSGESDFCDYLWLWCPHHRSLLSVLLPEITGWLSFSLLPLCCQLTQEKMFKRTQQHSFA